MSLLTQAKKNFSQEREEILQDFFSLLRFKSLSADPAYRKDLHACSLWIENYLKKCHLNVERWEKKGFPSILFAHTHLDPQKETILLYNHYDVQPIDPIELWTSDPFEPVIREGQIYARGASDNKGQLFYTLRALKTFLELVQPHFNIKYIIEGEEESGSEALSLFLSEKADDLKADHILIIDSGIPSIDRPTITLGARGIITMNLTLKEAQFDLHSGSHGGVVYNPNRALAELIASTHDKDNKVLIPHFYDDVTPLSHSEKALYDLTFDSIKFKKDFGAEPIGVETNFTPAEAIAFRPTLEINGIQGGYTGMGFKTVIPSQAIAKISCRLVPHQDPKKIGQIVKKYFESQVPKGMHLDVDILPGCGQGLRSNPHSKVALIAAQAYEDIFQKPCGKIIIGGSVPIASSLQKASGAALILIGLDLPTDKIHSPNEHFDLDRLEMGFLTIFRILELFQ